MQTRFEAKDRKKHEAGKLVKGRNEPCTIVQVRRGLVACSVLLFSWGWTGFTEGELPQQAPTCQWPADLHCQPVLHYCYCHRCWR